MQQTGAKGTLVSDFFMSSSPLGVVMCVCVCFSVSNNCVAYYVHSKRGYLFCGKVGNVVQGNETTNTFYHYQCRHFIGHRNVKQED